MSAEPLAGNTLVQALRAQFARDCGEVVVHETHISWVLLAGTQAFKIKKPVRLGFLDFSTLESRRHCCEEELRINRRLASALYLAVVPITGTADAPCLGGEGTPIEYAVQMRRFADGDLASERLASGALSVADLGSFAAHLSAFHESLPPAAKDSGFGTPGRVNRDLDLLFSDWPAAVDAPALDALGHWFATGKEQRDRWVAQRASAGRVRECHGDLHLDNVASFGGKLIAFDALEFDAGLRWIDVVSEMAFVTMDLRARGHAGLAHAFAASYLEAGGDYGGLPLLRTYEVYRAVVRARIARLRAGLSAAGAPPASTYMALAVRLAQPGEPRLLITQGLPGSGKTWVTQALLGVTGAMRVRSDVERNRMLGRDRHSGADSDAVYARLLEVARISLQSGYPTIVDAAFLQRDQRSPFAALATELGVPFTLLQCSAPLEVLRARVHERAARGQDASQADVKVLELLRTRIEPLTGDEAGRAIVLDTSGGPVVPELAREWDRMAGGIAGKTDLESHP